jgi:hypothetical protein
MPRRIPAAVLETIFAEEAPSKLPLEQAEIDRDERGILSYRWPSPCDALGSLWLWINRNEIVLGTRTFHTHVDPHAWEVRSRKPSPRDLARTIVGEAIEKAAAIMRGDFVFSVDYSADGNPSSYGMSSKDVLNPLRDGSVTLSSESKHFWDWRGEIAAV